MLKFVRLFNKWNVRVVPCNLQFAFAKTPQKWLPIFSKGKGEWNVYDVVCVDGVVKLSVNGKFVNGVSKASVKKGYLCLESEGAEIHFRNIKIMELPPGITTPEQTAPEVK